MLAQFSKDKPLLLTPGPVILHPQIKKALSRDMIHHRSASFQTLFKQCSEELKYFFQTKQEVLILCSTGTGAMEAAFTNSLSPGDQVLCVGGGKFGERWQAMAKSLGLFSHDLNVPWGQAVGLDQIQNSLKQNPKTKALILCACETSTGTQHPLPEIAEFLKSSYPDILLIVDAITALGASQLDMDKWGIDIMVAGSQKSFWLTTGLSFICLSQKAWDRASKSKLPKYYFELHREKQAQIKGQTAFSSPVSQIQALKVSLELLKNKGLKALIADCEKFKKTVRLFCSALDLKLYSSSPANALTAIEIKNADQLKKELEHSHHIIVAGGQEKLKNKILRIGHLGPLEPKDFLRALSLLALEIQKRDPSKDIKKALQVAHSVFNLDFDIPSLEKK